MKRLLLICCVTMVSCESVVMKVPQQMEEAIEARKKSDSILTEFRKVNAQIQKTQDSMTKALDSSFKRMDSALKSNTP